MAMRAGGLVDSGGGFSCHESCIQQIFIKLLLHGGCFAHHGGCYRDVDKCRPCLYGALSLVRVINEQGSK